MHKGFYTWKQINSDSVVGSFKEIWCFLASGLVFFRYFPPFAQDCCKEIIKKYYFLISIRRMIML